MRVISSPSISTSGVVILILSIGKTSFLLYAECGFRRYVQRFCPGKYSSLLLWMPEHKPYEHGDEYGRNQQKSKNVTEIFYTLFPVIRQLFQHRKL